MLGRIFTYVGTHHYRPKAIKGASVHFEREKNNIFDPYAIRLKDKDQIFMGYLPLQLSAMLSPVLDKDYISIEGFIYEDEEKYNMPIVIDVFKTAEGDRLFRSFSDNSKEYENYRNLADIYVNSDKYTSEQILKLKIYLDTILLTPESRLLHQLLDWKHLNASLSGEKQNIISESPYCSTLC